MSDLKNIEKLLSDMQEKELPNGYDERFYAKMDRDENPMAWFKSIFSFSMPTNLGMAAALGAALFISLKFLKVTDADNSEDLAVNDEIDLLEDLDVLENWDDQEDA